MKATLVADFFVPGLPQPGGSKRAFMRPGMRAPVITDANPKAKGWQSCVKEFAAPHAPAELLDGALAVEIEFRMPRPQGHFGKHGVRASAPAWPTVKPDATKLWRSTEDGLTGVLWRDDARIVCQLVRKAYAEDGRTGAHVRVFTLAAEVQGEKCQNREGALLLAQGGLF